MRLFSISLRNLRIRIVSSVLTAVSIVVATGLYAAIMLMIDQTNERYKASISGFQAVIGPKDVSQLELVLNTIFNVGHPSALIRLQVYDDVRSGRIGNRRAEVRYAIPQARGDSFSQYSFPVIGTTDDMFLAFERDGATLGFAAGGPWRFSHDDLMELGAALARRENARLAGNGTPVPRVEFEARWKKAVLGARVSRTLGLGLGDSIVPMHGKAGEPGAHEHPEAACEVVGVLEPTNSPLDSTIFIPLAAHFLIGGHAEGIFQPEPPAPGRPPIDVEVGPGDLALTAVVADPKDHFGARILRRELSARPDAQAAWPQDVVPRFLRDIGSISAALEVVAWLVLLVAAVSISVSIYNTMNERRREIAIMRGLGARRSQIMTIILLESVFLSFLGALVGILACHATALFMRETVEDMTGVYLDWTAFSVDEMYLIAAVTALGAVAGILPAVKGSMTQVADNLAPNY